MHGRSWLAWCSRARPWKGLHVFFATVAPEFAKVVRLHSLDLDYRVFFFALGCRRAVGGGRGAAAGPASDAA